MRISTTLMMVVAALLLSAAVSADAQEFSLVNSGKSFYGAAKTRIVPTRRVSRAAPSGHQAVIIGGRPAGCPHRYCGCGLRKYLGLRDKRLNLAANWARLFPRVAGPAPGVAAVRRGGGHVMYIERSVGNGRWLVRDYNSGGGLSRLHVRSVRGYVFVNPHVTTTLAASRDSRG